MDSFELFHLAWPPLVALAAVAFLYVVSYATLTLCGFRYLRLSIGVTTARMLAAVIVMFTCLLVLVVLWPAADLRVAHTFDRITLRTVAQHGDTTYFVDLVAGDDTAAYMDGNCGRDGAVRYRSAFSTGIRRHADSAVARLVRNKMLAYDVCADVVISVQPKGL